MKLVKENRKKIILTFSLLLLIGCGNQAEKDIAKYARVYARLTFISQLYAGAPDSIKVHEKKVFKKFGITEDAYWKKVKSLRENTETWNKFFELSVKELNKIKKEIKRKK